ncbi:fatty acyl-CoA reductase 1-like [Belonocnema kinseyi]|uniref:fatty acyl-CoA reductase 1-like n=1 Tax=Belonocnema kinseyi TaxID=2817044 RepID=UPI00143CF4C5|nr:fatty acyl-CoA reductase 1-like [Belonocnema kinseyi]
MDAIYKRIGVDSEPQQIGEGESEIRKFYTGKTVLITGATGTLGKLVVEKLLRECSDLKKIFVLCRVKEDLSLNERRDALLQSIVFDKVRSQTPDFDKKVVAIEGDVRQQNLGLSDVDRSTILEETQICFHCASTEKHENDVSITLRLNVLGTKHILDLSKNCKKLEAFMYVSTVFAHAPEKDIKEEFYRPPGDLKFVADLLQAEEETGGLTKDAIATAIGEWPDLHVFSRSTAEDLVRDCGKRVNFSCGVFRPSIMISTFKEPIEGWCENIDAPSYICLGAGLGCIHTTYMLDFPMDCVPLDMCANALIASTWDLVSKEKQGKETSIYNYGTSNLKPITFKRFYDLVLADSESSPPSKKVWGVFNIRTDKLWLFHILHILFHIIPAFVAYTVTCLRGGMDCKKCCRKSGKKQPTLCRLIRQFKSVIYYCNGGWRVHVNQMQTVWDKMNSSDKQLFFCDIRDFDWRDYIDSYWSGLRLYLLNDPIETIQEAKKKTQKLNMTHRILTTVIVLVFIYWIISCRCPLKLFS